MVGLENQNEYNRIDFLVTVAYFLGQKQKMDVWRASSLNVDTTFFVE
jgi:hypothetical protein